MVNGTDIYKCNEKQVQWSKLSKLLIVLQKYRVNNLRYSDTAAQQFLRLFK